MLYKDYRALLSSPLLTVVELVGATGSGGDVTELVFVRSFLFFFIKALFMFFIFVSSLHETFNH